MLLMAVERIVDLSHSIEAGITVYPGDPVVSLAPAATIAEDGFNVLRVHMGSQSGTHVDAPFHFLAAGARIDQLDLSLFLGRGLVIALGERAPRSPITWSDLEPFATQVRPSQLVLLHTGWSRFWGSDQYFEHPYLDAAAAGRLVDLGIRAVGIDALSIDETILAGDHPTGFAAHHVLLGAGGVIVENLTNLEQVDWPDPLISVLPLKITGADGAPVRAVAIDLGAAGR
jgi:kynurenine formamidase